MTNEEIDLSDVEQAAKMIYFGLEEPRRLSSNPEFIELVSKYKGQSKFRAIVKAIANGLSLDILAVEEAMIFLRPHESSIFAYKRSDLQNLLGKGHDKYVGVVLVGLAAFLFPRAGSFDEKSPQFTQPITVEDLNSFIEEKCRNLKESVKVVDEEEHQDSLIPLFVSFLNLPGEDVLNSKAQNTRNAYIRKVFNFLEEQSLFLKNDNRYWPTPKFWHQMKALAERTDIMNVVNQVLGGQ